MPLESASHLSEIFIQIGYFFKELCNKTKVDVFFWTQCKLFTECSKKSSPFRGINILCNYVTTEHLQWHTCTIFYFTAGKNVKAMWNLVLQPKDFSMFCLHLEENTFMSH